MQKTIRLVIFDLDGTLVNAYPAITASFNYTMKRLRQPARTPAVIRRAVGRGDRNLLRPFVARGLLAEALAIYRRHHGVALQKKSRLMPGARSVLTYLKTRGVRLAVATNRPKRFSWIIIRHLAIGRYFDYVLCGDELTRMKPHPEILQRIMRALNTHASCTCFIGDMPIDARTARRAHVRSIAVATGSSTARELAAEGPDHLIAHLRELKKIL